MDGPFSSRKLLEPRHWFILGVLGTASFFEGYDFYAVTVALPQIRHTFGLSQSAAAGWLSLLYLGALPAIFFTRRADLLGRRRLLITTVAGYTLFTGASALAPSIQAFAACQLFARAFSVAEVAIAWAMVAEELPAGARGFGFGWLAMSSALGSGLGALLYGTVLAPLGISWRWLYAIAIPPLLLVIYLRRRLPETRRFQAAERDGRLVRHWDQILRGPHRSRFALVGAAAALAALAQQASTFVIDFMQTQRHLSPRASNLILVAAGGLAIPVLVGAGSLGDRFGRKRVGCTSIAVGLIGGFALFVLARTPAELFAALALTFVGQFGALPTIGGFATELFPTQLRALGGAWASASRVTGQFASFLLASQLIGRLGFSRTAVALGAGPLLAIVVVALKFPETRSMELEDIAPDLVL